MQTDSTVSRLAHEFRDMVNTSHIHDRLAKDRKKFSRLCASMDLIEDTNMAIAAYLTGKKRTDKGHLYLMAYGLLQALFVQQDALRNAADVVGMPYKLPDSVQRTVRDVRNQAIGHPTNCGGESFGIIHISLSSERFELYSFDWDDDWKPEPIEFRSLIDTQSAHVGSTLQEMITHLRNLPA